MKTKLHQLLILFEIILKTDKMYEEIQFQEQVRYAVSSGERFYVYINSR